MFRWSRLQLYFLSFSWMSTTLLRSNLFVSHVFPVNQSFIPGVVIIEPEVAQPKSNVLSTLLYHMNTYRPHSNSALKFTCTFFSSWRQRQRFRAYQTLCYSVLRDFTAFLGVNSLLHALNVVLSRLDSRGCHFESHSRMNFTETLFSDHSLSLFDLSCIWLIYSSLCVTR